MNEPTAPNDFYTDRELLYAATARCKCGAGLAHPLDHEAAWKLRAWVCSAVLKGEGAGVSERWPGRVTSANAVEQPHDRYDFGMWKVREETSINNQGSFTTRPPGTLARTVGRATCPKCHHKWESEPYDAPQSPGHHWRSGPCPQCGYAVGSLTEFVAVEAPGGGGVWRSEDGEPIDQRYWDVVLDSPVQP